MKQILAAALLLLLLPGCAPKERSTDFFAMNTFMSVSAYGKEAQRLADGMEKKINELDAALSRTQTAGEVYRLNHAGGQITEVSEEVYAVIEQALNFAGETGGAFDPTLAPLTDLWQIGTEQEHIPDRQELLDALEHVGYQNVRLLGGGQVQLLNGAQLDLGGIGKGFAADRIRELPEKERIVGEWSLLAQLGGNIGAYGENPARKGGGWVIGIANPDAPNELLATVEGRDLAVVTSGDYERYFERDGKRYHHIFDPETGCPAESGLRSVTVIDESGTRADALTTALFVMGMTDGRAFCEQNAVAAVFVTEDRRLYTTERVHELCDFVFEGDKMGYTYVQ